MLQVSASGLERQAGGALLRVLRFRSCAFFLRKTGYGSAVAPTLTPDQARALTLLQQGQSTADVAQQLGLPRPTVWRWQHELPQFAGTVEATERGLAASRQRALTRQEKLRIGLTLVVVLLAALFLYLGYAT